MRRMAVWSGLLVLGPCLFADAKPATPPPATVNAYGSVTIDGKPVAGSQNLFPGEKLVTREQGTANVSSDGLIVSVYGSTALVYGVNQLDLDCGVVEVTTRGNFKVNAQNLEIAPSTPASSDSEAKPTVFQVAQGNHKVLVKPEQGPVTVTEDRNNPVVLNGQAHEYDKPKDCPHPLTPWIPVGIFTGESIWRWFDLDNDHRNPLSPSKP